MPEYKVSVGSIARTLLYEDAKGTITFTFDVDSSSGHKTVILDRHSKSIIDAEQLRIDLAFKQAEEYLISRGYKVEFSGG